MYLDWHTSWPDGKWNHDLWAILKKDSSVPGQEWFVFELDKTNRVTARLHEDRVFLHCNNNPIPDIVFALSESKDRIVIL
jgi:hypothetical protein